MSENVQKTGGQPRSYKFDRGGAITEFGPFIGVVKNNVDPTLSGRLQVYIEQFGGENPDDKSLWRTVTFAPPFYGTTPINNESGSQGSGSYRGNYNSYGWWMTPPDLGVKVICFFVSGDPNQGYYIGCVPEPGVTQMIPAIGGSETYQPGTSQQQNSIGASGAEQVPVVEVNSENEATYENPKFATEPKPIHSYQFATFNTQGLLADKTRGPISSSVQRESPSQVYGFSTPGRPVYQGGMTDEDIRQQVDSGAVSREDLKIEGRRGGHTFVMDDGDLSGNDNLIRIRTSKGHQITMSDDQDCFYITSASGKTWIEFGSEGTVDVFSTNSINMRTQGTVNIHADADINMYAGENFNMMSGNVNITGTEGTNVLSSKYISVATQGQVDIQGGDALLMATGGTGAWSAKTLNLKGTPILLNTGVPKAPKTAAALRTFQFDDTVFSESSGWQVAPGALQSIVTRAPTHEPFPFHNKGVEINPETAAPTPGTGPTLPSLNSALSTARQTNTVNNPIDVESVFTTPYVSEGVGGLNTSQVTGLLAETAQAIGQPSNVVDAIKGIGKYGLQVEQLESAGYLKPGTTEYARSLPVTVTAEDEAQAQTLLQQGQNITAEIVAQGRIINNVIKSPQIWTGLNKVEDINILLNNPILQGQVQTDLLQNGFGALKQIGLITGNERVADIAGMLQGAAQFGVQDMTSFALGLLPGEVGAKINQTIANVDYAMSLVDQGIGSFEALKAGDILGGGTGIINAISGLAGLFGGGGGRRIQQRLNSPAVQTFLYAANVAVSVQRIINDSKVTDPQYEPKERDAVPPSRFAQTFQDFTRELFEIRNGLTGALNQLQLINNEITALFDQIGLGGVSDPIPLRQRYDSLGNRYDILLRQLATTNTTVVAGRLQQLPGGRRTELAGTLFGVQNLEQETLRVNNSVSTGLRVLNDLIGTG